MYVVSIFGAVRQLLCRVEVYLMRISANHTLFVFRLEQYVSANRHVLKQLVNSGFVSNKFAARPVALS